MADETPKTAPASTPKIPKSPTKRLSAGYRKYIRRRKAAARRPYGAQG